MQISGVLNFLIMQFLGVSNFLIMQIPAGSWAGRDAVFDARAAGLPSGGGGAGGFAAVAEAPLGGAFLMAPVQAVDNFGP